MFLLRGCVHPVTPTVRSGDDTPLHLAAVAGCLETVRFLVGAGADLHSKNGYYALSCRTMTTRLTPARHRHGCTPLHAAAKGGHLETVQMLVVAGADVRMKCG